IQIYILEEYFARTGFYLLQSVSELEESYGTGDPPNVPIRVKRSIQAIRRIVRTQAKRWGWYYHDNLGEPLWIDNPDGQTWIAGCLEGHLDRKEYPFLQAVFTWRSAEDVPEHLAADEAADRAISLGIQIDPGLTPEQAEALTYQRHEAWC